MTGPDEFLDDIPVGNDSEESGDSDFASQLQELHAEVEAAEEPVEEVAEEQHAETDAERDVMDDDKPPAEEEEPEPEPSIFETFLSQVNDATRSAIWEMGIKDLAALTAMFDVDLVAPRGKLTADQLIEVEQWLARHQLEIKHQPKTQPSAVTEVPIQGYQPTTARHLDRETHLRSLRSTR